MRVSFYGRCRGESESRYVNDCLYSGLETDGFFMKMLVKKWKNYIPGTDPLFTTSCTSALEMAVACLDMEPGDEVIIPSYNFPSAANAVLLHGGVPVLCDIDGDTQNISVEDMLGRIGPRTRAVVAVHYGGVSCPMMELKEALRAAGIALIEDAAQGIGAFYVGMGMDGTGLWNGRQDGDGPHRFPLGSMGDFGALSFHHTKNITCGEGGILIARSRKDYRTACQYRLHGTDRAMYLAGEVDRYTWNMPGSCTAMSELQAAVLASQMELLEDRYVTNLPGKVTFGVSSQHYTFTENAFVELVKRFGQERYAFYYNETGTHQILDDVKNRVCDLGILYLSHENEVVMRKVIEENHLVFTQLFSAKPHVFLQKDHPLASKKVVFIHDLAPYPRLNFVQGEYESVYFS